MKDFLRTLDLSREDLHNVLERASALSRDPDGAAGLLQGDIVVLHFERPSTRTRLSFEAAIARLGGQSVLVAASDLQLTRGETMEDTARVASSYARAWIMRSVRHNDVERFARAATIPVVNALTDAHHPCQSLADLMTMKERFGRLDGLRVAYVGVGSNVANSLIEAGALAGLDLHVASPPDHAPNPAVVERARTVARKHGGIVELHDDARDAVAGAHVVYTGVWAGLTDNPETGRGRRPSLVPYRVDAALMARARPEAIFMHCLPCHRGEEVTAEVVDGPQSVVFAQAANRLHTSVALLDALLRSALTGGAHDDA